MALREWVRKLFRHDDLEAARARVEIDIEKVQTTADRIDQGAGDLEARVKVNHISATVSALLRGTR